MTQKTVSRWMMVAGGLAAVGVLALALVYAPVLANDFRSMYPEYAPLYWPGLIGVWMIAGLFTLGLYEYFLVCARIGKDRSFCRENVRSLERISLYMLVMACLWIAAIFAPGLLFRLDVGPVWILFLLCAMASAALGILACGLSKLLKRAGDIKEENDLTV